MKKFLLFIVVLANLVFAGVVLWLANNAHSPTESALASVFLSLLSIAATWIVSHYYYERSREHEVERVAKQHDESLKTFARKAAEKVTNLSKELDRLSTYLREYIENEPVAAEDLDLVVAVRDERVTGAIHIVEMLRSVNDTSLSDWHGVIGEELERKKEIEEKIEERREEKLVQLADRLELLLTQRNEPTGRPMDAVINAALEELRRKVSDVAAAIGRQPSPITLHRAKMRISVSCPACGSPIEIALTRGGKVKSKTYVCGSCKSRLVAKADVSGEPVVAVRKEVEEAVNCPNCGDSQTFRLDNVLGATGVFACVHCKKPFRASRGNKGLNVSVETAQTFVVGGIVTQEFIESVRLSLPAQPWPTGIHHTIAAKLNVPSSAVTKAIRSLIKAGVYKEQVDGQLLESEVADG